MKRKIDDRLLTSAVERDLDRSAEDRRMAEELSDHVAILSERGRKSSSALLPDSLRIMMDPSSDG